MKIEGTPKEIADFIMQLQSQHKLNNKSDLNKVGKSITNPLTKN